jgi:hypothetical protein
VTPKQIERIKIKIKRIKAELAADKKQWGGFYHDGRGLRYLPPSLYIQIEDYTGGLRYINWFLKNFPEDYAFPDFFFENAIIFYKTNRKKEAERKIFETFCSNTYVLDKFFENQIIPIEKYEDNNMEGPSYCENFPYTQKQENLVDISEWLTGYIKSEKFTELCSKYIDIHKRLMNENDVETRGYLFQQADVLVNEL